MSTTIRVSEAARATASALSARTGRQMGTVVEEALAAYERTLFWESFEAGYRALADSPDDWSEIEAERSGEAPALRDGSL